MIVHAKSTYIYVHMTTMLSTKYFKHNNISKLEEIKKNRKMYHMTLIKESRLSILYWDALNFWAYKLYRTRKRQFSNVRSIKVIWYSLSCLNVYAPNSKDVKCLEEKTNKTRRKVCDKIHCRFNLSLCVDRLNKLNQ